jgi:hypothetical protein
LRFPRPRHLSAAQQLHLIRQSVICPGQGGIRQGKLTWDFEARPTPNSRKYQLRIVFSTNRNPEVFAIDPDLSALAEGRRIPHVYDQSPTRLCVHFPGEWKPYMQIAATIVPWAILWLYYFEVWLATDQWEGGGRHPEV